MPLFEFLPKFFPSMRHLSSIQLPNAQDSLGKTNARLDPGAVIIPYEGIERQFQSG
jgi:hypothetical protein